MTQTIIASIIIATVLSAVGVGVSVQVIDAELERAQGDVASATEASTSNREELVALKAARAVESQRDDERWDDVRASLVKIRGTQEKILLRLPDRWRQPDGRRR